MNLVLQASTLCTPTCRLLSFLVPRYCHPFRSRLLSFPVQCPSQSTVAWTGHSAARALYQILASTFRRLSFCPAVTMPLAMCDSCTRLTGLCASRRAQRQIRLCLRRRRNTTSPPRLVISIHHYNATAVPNHAPPWARFVAVSWAHRALRRVAVQVRQFVVPRIPLLRRRLSVWCATRVCTQTQ